MTVYHISYHTQMVESHEFVIFIHNIQENLRFFLIGYHCRFIFPSACAPLPRSLALPMLPTPRELRSHQHPGQQPSSYHNRVLRA